MTWAKFDDALPSNRKWRRVVKRSPAAGCLWVAAICYSARYLTDGRIPKAELDEVAPVPKPEKLAALLVEEGMFEDRGDAWFVHDYLDWNPTAAEVKAKQEAERERKARQRQKGSRSVTNGPGGRFVPVGQTVGQPPGQDVGHPPDDHPPSRGVSPATRPVPSRPQEPLAAKPPQARPPDPLFDALVASCGINPAEMTSGARGSTNSALKALREVGATPEEVTKRARRYQAEHADWPLTPTSLAKHWPTLGGPVGGRPVSYEAPAQRYR